MGIGDFLNSVGDAIEDGVESATEKVGQAYNTVLDAESKVAKAVGADGLSEWLDDLGDKVVDATGGAVPEKELGQTTDPKELIRGDVGKINEVTGHLGKIGTAIEQTGDALRKIDTADWTGDAAAAFDEEFAKQPKLWWDGADAMSKAKTALDAWAHEVTAAQAKAADAIAKWEEADREERDRKNAWNALSDDDRKGKNLTDTWTDIRNAAKAILAGARTQRDNAADTAVAAISAATATAPTEPPFLSRWGSNFEDLGAAIEQARLNFSTGLLTSLTGMVQFVRSISPIDAYNITHPAEYMSSMSDLGTGMVLAAADPKATGAAMLAGFKTNPSEALGALTGDALLTVATGGAGGAAKAGATVVDKASDAARLGNAGRNVVDDAAGTAGRNAPEPPKTQPAAATPDSPSAPATNPAATPDNPSAPETNPAGHTGDSPAATPERPATTPESPGTHPAANPENPAAATPESPGPTPAAQTGDTPPATTPDSPGSPLTGATDEATPNTGDPSPPHATTPDPDSQAPHTTPDNNPAASPDNPADRPTEKDGTGPNPAATSPDSDPPAATPESAREPDSDSPGVASPNHPDNALGDNTPDSGDSAPPPTHPDNTSPNSDDAGGRPDDSSGDTHAGAHNDPDGGTPANPRNNTEPVVRAGDDNGSSGNPSASEAAQADPPTKNATDDQTPKAGDPVKIATGDFLLPLTDIDLPGVLRLALKRAHHSNYRFGRWFGPSWSATLDMRVVVEADCVTVIFEDGMLLAYPHAEVGVGVEPITGGQRWKLTRTDTGGYRLWDPDRELVWHFAPEPTLDGLDALLGNYAISAITDRHHNRIRFHYNANGDPIEVTHSGGYRVVLDSADGRVTAISVAGEVYGTETSTLVRKFGYNNGELTTVTNGVGGVTRFAYDDQHRMLSWTDSNGSWVTNTYDESGRVVSQRGADGVFDAEYEYLEFGNGTGRLTRMTDSRGAVTGYGFDNDLRLRDVRAPDGGHRHIDYNAARNPLAVTEPDGATTTYSYTSDGDVAAITRPDGRQITIDYAYPNRPSTITNADGTTQHREWDKAGNLVAVTDPAGARTEYRHHECGAVAEIRDPDGALTYIEVDSAGLPVKVTDPYGATTEIQRDLFGRPIQVTDQLGAVTRYEWTPEGRPARRIDPDGHSEAWTYDGENNLLTHTNRAGHVTSYTYGGFDKISTRTDPDGSVHRYLYNTERALTAVINPLGQRWTYEYDLAGRLKAETDYTGATTHYTHTPTGRVATVTPATGVTRHHTYDNLGNLLDITADTGEYIRNTYDPAGRVLTAVNGTAEAITHTLSFAYTPTGQVATEQLDDQPPLRNDYDHRSRRISRTTPSGSVTTWHHDTLNRVASLDADGERITFTYDPTSRLTGWRIGEVQIDRTFTPTNQLASQTVTGFPSLGLTLDFGDTPPRPDPFVIRHDDYAYRPDGFLTTHTTTRPDSTPTHRRYDLDPIGRVAAIIDNGAISEAYTYDALSNITSSLTPSDPSPDTPTSPTAPATTDRREYHNNLLVRDGRNHYYYDPAGRLIRKVTTRVSRQPDVWHYRYNAFDQLTDVYTPDLRWWRYTYDAYGRRCSKQRIDSSGRVLDRVEFKWDNSETYEQNSREGTVRWNYEPGTFTPITQTSTSGTYVAVSGPTGNPAIVIVKESAEVAGIASDELWGRSLWRGDAGLPWRFPGQYYDAETALHYNRHRIYDPHISRYLTSDPIGLGASANPNIYPINPSRWSDPLGLVPEYTGTVWDSITPTQPNYPGSELPRSFELSLGDESVWVNGNGTKHMAEYLGFLADSGASRAAIEMATQGQLSSLRAALIESSAGGIPLERLINAGGWELKISAPRFEGGFPAVIHALIR
ncbi:putative T7SS-secreted protein [Nocardia rhizosphaerihabitans]|uniref:putative T7SS-secreted protein n=1 Tax=Nocardia rhizosphaerihabitans TaxID=1691570 RepID=UPI00366E1D8D